MGFESLAGSLNQDAFEKVLRISEEFFGTKTDPSQMPITQESTDKLYSIHPDTVIYKFDEAGNPIAWVVVVPTSLDTMHLFLERKITENELLEIAAKEKKSEALYLCGVFVLPEYRKKGYTKALLLEALKKIPNADKATLYAWIYSREGEKLNASLAKEIGRPILSITNKNLE